MKKPTCLVETLRLTKAQGQPPPPVEVLRARVEQSIQSRMDEGYTLRAALPIARHREENTDIVFLVFVRKENHQ